MTTLTESSETLLLADADWWRQAAVYQIYPRSFADANGDGILSRDELRRLGPICTKCSAAQKRKEEDDAKERTPLALLGQRVVDLFSP